MKCIKTWCAALLCAGTVLSSHASYLSDMWWKPDESGWGASVVQQGDATFVSLFVYGPNGEPIWYVADTRTFALTADGSPAVLGPLYRTRGPWFGGAFDPKSVQTVAVGSLLIEPLGGTGGNVARFLYTVDGVRVEKLVSRFTFRVPSDFPASLGYFGAMHVTRRSANQPPVPVSTSGAVTAFIENGAVSINFKSASDDCTFTGTITQFGKFSNVFGGAYRCNGGDFGFVHLTEMELNRYGFTSQISLISSASAGTTFGGTIAGARR
jgi:hypothetical protein